MARVSERLGMSGRCDVAVFEDGERGPQAKEYMWPWQAGKGKEMDSPLELAER